MSWYDSGMPVINDPDVLCTAELIKRLFAMPGCDLGGPLHVIVYDYNTEDAHVCDGDYFGLREGRTVETYLSKHRWVTGIGHVYDDVLDVPQEVADLCRLILASLARMPEPWRAAAIAWADGTAWDGLEQFAGETLTGGPPWVSPERVDSFIVELHQWIAQGGQPAPRVCAPVPCPPFEPFPPAPAIQGIERTRRHEAVPGGIKITRMDERGNPIGEPQVVAGWGDAGFTLSEPGQDGDKPLLKWVETTVELGTLPPEWASLLFGDDLPVVDMQQVRDEPPQVKMPPLPVFVNTPEDSSIDAVGAAIALCGRLGLLKDAPAGHVIVPHGVQLDEGGYFLVPPGKDTP